MRGTVTHLLFFAIDDDLLPVFGMVEGKYSLAYVPTGQFSHRSLSLISHGREIPNLGSANDDSSIRCETYLVTKDSTPVEFRAIRRVDGSERFIIDQLLNPDSVTFTSGGKWGDAVLHGRVATASDSDTSKDLMKIFNRAIKKHFKKVRAYWVGPTAYAFLEAGGRLTAAAQSPADFDLAIDPR